jgi:hypothetical protein
MPTASELSQRRRSTAFRCQWTKSARADVGPEPAACANQIGEVAPFVEGSADRIRGTTSFGGRKLRKRSCLLVP